MARAFTGCAAVVAAGRTRADGGGARQADRGRRESCVVLRGFCEPSLALGRRGRVDEQGNRGGLSGAGYRLRTESGKSRGAARVRAAGRGRTDAVLPQIVRRTYLCHRDHAAALITPAKTLRAVAAGRAEDVLHDNDESTKIAVVCGRNAVIPPHGQAARQASRPLPTSWR